MIKHSPQCKGWHFRTTNIRVSSNNRTPQSISLVSFQWPKREVYVYTAKTAKKHNTTTPGRANSHSGASSRLLPLLAFAAGADRGRRHVAAHSEPRCGRRRPRKTQRLGVPPFLEGSKEVTQNGPKTSHPFGKTHPTGRCLSLSARCRSCTASSQRLPGAEWMDSASGRLLVVLRALVNKAETFPFLGSDHFWVPDTHLFIRTGSLI